jgi:hypothetical protein
MPGEAEGLGVAAGGMLKTGAQMLNPVEAVYGIGEMASGIANDVVRATGGTPRKDAPSFSGDLTNLADSAYNQPVQTAIDMVTAPGSIPGMFTGMKMPKIPKGTGWELMRERPGFKDVRKSLKDPGFKDVRKSLKDVDRYDYISPDYRNTPKGRRVKKGNFMEDIEKAVYEPYSKGELKPPLTKRERVLESWNELDGAGGMLSYTHDEDLTLYKKRFCLTKVIICQIGEDT